MNLDTHEIEGIHVDEEKQENIFLFKSSKNCKPGYFRWGKISRLYQQDLTHCCSFQDLD